MASVLITGSNRGIGLAFATSYAADGWRVFATCRDPEAATSLARLKSVHDGVSVHALDVTAGASIRALAKELADEAIDVLVNNAGVGGFGGGLGDLDYGEWHRTLDVNTLGPVRVAEAFIEHVARGKKKVIAAVTSGMGSIEDNTSGAMYAYRSSKAALNMAFRSLAVDLRPRGIACVLLNPGWVKTDMGGRGGRWTPDESVGRMRKVLDGITLRDSGRFLNHDGADYPW